MASLSSEQRCEEILNFQYSSWYERFANIMMKSTVIRPLDTQFLEYLASDGVIIPAGSEDCATTPKSELSDSESEVDSDSDSDVPVKTYSFPALDARIRLAIEEYGAVFPKLNFTAPKDAAWAVSELSPLKCTSPANIYVLLKSSDLVTHDTDPALVFQGCIDSETSEHYHSYQLELVLKKWYSFDSSREFRCFVRRNMLVGISQRDMTYYEFLQSEDIRQRIIHTVTQFWQSWISGRWTTNDYTFDIFLTSSWNDARLIDFNPFCTKTDPLLFDYEEFDDVQSRCSTVLRPQLRIFDRLSSSRHQNQFLQDFHRNRYPIDAFQALTMDDLPLI